MSWNVIEKTETENVETKKIEKNMSNDENAERKNVEKLEDGVNRQYTIDVVFY
jgi:hypothetical protein